ncbi:unnamed protein product [Urochloa humidicola]
MEEQGYWTNLVEGNGDLNLHGLGSLSEEQQSHVVERTPSTRPNQKRAKNFNEDEDKLLVSAWLNISTDPVQGTNQTKGSFWTRVYNYYHSNKEFTSERSQSSLLHRWKGILVSVNKFCGCVNRIEGRNQSGVTFQDKLMQALALYKAEDHENKSFQLLHCWNILKTQPKWHDKQKQLAAEKQLGNKKQKANTDSSPRTSTPIDVDSTNLDIAENGPPETDVPKRPMGKKKAKEALRRGGGNACVEALDHLWEKKRESDVEKEQKKEQRYNQSYTLEKERLELEKRRVEAEEARAANEAKSLKIKEIELEQNKIELEHKRMLDEERIITMDIASMPLLQQQYYKSLQDGIISRSVSN